MVDGELMRARATPACVTGRRRASWAHPLPDYHSPLDDARGGPQVSLERHHVTGSLVRATYAWSFAAYMPGCVRVPQIERLGNRRVLPPVICTKRVGGYVARKSGRALGTSITPLTQSERGGEPYVRQDAVDASRAEPNRSFNAA